MVGCLEGLAELQHMPIAVPELRLSADLGSTLAELCADRYTIADYPAGYVDLEGLEHLDSNRHPDFGATEPLAVALVRLNPPVWGTEQHFRPRREDN